MADLIAWAERFIATPSESRLGNEAIAALAAELLGSLGLPARIESADVAGTRHHAVICDVGPAPAGDGLLLVTHLDTVPPGDFASWTATGGDPYRATRDGDRLFGLGSADAKVDFVCKALALARVPRARLIRAVRLVGTFGEEIGLLGARWLVERGLARGFADALVGEPSELAAVHAHKGYAVFEARVALERLACAQSLHVARRVARGVAAHSSSPALGANAIVAALETLASSDAPGLCALEGGTVVNVVPERCALALVGKDAGDGLDAPAFAKAPLVRFLEAWRRFEASLGAPRDPAFDPDRTVASLGRVALEGAQAVFRFDVRPIPGAPAPESLVAPLREAAEVGCVRANPPLATPRDDAFVRAIEDAQRAAGAPARVTTKATCTEAGLLAQAGLRALVLGPGPSVGNVHKPNEHTRVSDLHRAVVLYRAVIERRVCAGGATCS